MISFVKMCKTFVVSQKFIMQIWEKIFSHKNFVPFLWKNFLFFSFGKILKKIFFKMKLRGDFPLGKVIFF